MNLAHCAVRLPARKVRKDRPARRQIFWQCPPLTPGTQHLQEPIEDFPDIHRPQSPAGQTLEPAVGIMQQALALNDSWFWVHIFSGYLSLYQQQYDQALTEMERAVALAPTVAESYAALAEVLSCMGRTADALNAAAQAQHQKNEFADDHIASIGTAYTIAGRYEEARPLLLRSLSRYPNILRIHLTLATVYSELGQDAEARAEVAEVLRLNPQFSLEVHKQRTPIKDP